MATYANWEYGTREPDNHLNRFSCYLRSNSWLSVEREDGYKKNGLIHLMEIVTNKGMLHILMMMQQKKKLKKFTLYRV